MAFKMKGVSFTNKPYNISKSNIAGIGVIANKDFKKGDFIESAFDDESLIPNADTRTNFGKSLNHQKNCNANQKSENNKLNVYACKNIKKGEEITINYNNAPEYVRTAVNTKGYKEV